MGIGLCTVLWVCQPKCHCKASESPEVPPLQRLLMHNAEWQIRKPVFRGTFVNFKLWGVCTADIQQYFSVCLSLLYISSDSLSPGTVCGPPPTCWVTRSGLASWSTFPVESCRVRMLRFATRLSRRMRSPTSLSVRKTIHSTTTTMRPQCED